MKNFKLTDETIKVYGKTLYRIECIKDFQHAKVGDKGGFVESEDNLGGNAWIGNNACVFEDARVFEDAMVSGDACVYDDACVFGSAYVYGNACIFDNARVFEDACVCGYACVYGNARVYGSAEIGGSAKVFDGEWSETPFQIQGSKHFVNMCSPTKLTIGCQKHTLSFWKENFKEIGEEQGYTKEQIKEYKKYVDLAIEKYKIK